MKNLAREYQAVVNVPFGAVGIIMDKGLLTKIDLFPDPTGAVFCIDDSAAGVAAILQRYFQDPGASLEMKLKTGGSDFQQNVWKRLLQIPLGSTATYGQLADQLNSSPRAVGNACRSNPCPLVIPCHRVVGKSGLGGFSGQISGPKLAIKRWLLTHEGWL